MLTSEQQAAFIEELPDIFLPIAGGWGRMGMTHVRLAAVKEDILTGALHAAWRLRVEKNGKSRRKGTKRTDVQASQMPGKKGRKAERKKP